MNTTAKGDLLENQVYEILCRIKKSGIYGRHTQIFKHKKYFYNPTKTYKIIDVSIEQYLEEGDKDPFIIYAFECKNYNRKVDISELEEFDTKLRGIAERAIKGAIVTTVGYSKPSLQFANTKQISLIRIVNNDFDYILKREIHDFTYYNQSIEQLCNNSKKTCVFYNNEFLSIIDLLHVNGVSINFDNIFKVPYLTFRGIEDKVCSFRDTYGISVNDTIDTILQKCNLKLRYHNLPEIMLGKLQINDNSVYVNSSLKTNLKRRNFTIAHEIGHWYLHSQLLKDSIESYGDTLETTGFMDKTEQRLEMQANYFASILLIPKEIIQNELGEILEKYDIRRLPIYVDTQKCNISNYHIIVGEFAQKHNLSKKVVAYRLMDLKLLDLTQEAKSSLL